MSVFPERMPLGEKNRIKAHLNFVDKILNVEQEIQEDTIGKPLCYNVEYEWKNKKYRTTFFRRRYSSYTVSKY